MKLFIFILLVSSSLFSDSFSTRYDVNVGMFGKVGYADVTLKEHSGKYEMKLVATLTGTAANLTGNRIDTYVSKGEILDGKYIPDTFIKIKKTNRKERVQTYSFDHINKTVALIETNSKWVSETKFDTKKFKLVKHDVQENSSSNTNLDNYHNQDILSAYLNTRDSCNAQNTEFDLLAVGAHNDDKDITLSFLEGIHKQEGAQHFSSKEGHIYNLSVIPIDKDEKRVDVLIALDNDGLIKEAVLGDIFWIGEVNAKRVYHQVSSN